jgi:hypothetical protein
MIGLTPAALSLPEEVLTTMNAPSGEGGISSILIRRLHIGNSSFKYQEKARAGGQCRYEPQPQRRIVCLSE